MKREKTFVDLARENITQVMKDAVKTSENNTLIPAVAYIQETAELMPHLVTSQAAITDTLFTIVELLSDIRSALYKGEGGTNADTADSGEQ